MNRIVIIGATGTGKSTLAQRLSHVLGHPVVEMDDLYWRPGWTTAQPEEFCRDLDAATQGTRWIVAGNYGKQSSFLHWKRADTIIWLDYSFPRVFWRLLTRCLARIHDKKQICNGNIETLGKFFSRDSIMIWLFQSYWRRRREFPALLARPEHGHLKLHRFRKPAETEAFLKSLDRHREAA